MECRDCGRAAGCQRTRTGAALNMSAALTTIDFLCLRISTSFTGDWNRRALA
tara:strand:- start:22494 stop:22649 length:156 start_codon:yes stop_codon:yes gene_type:complete